MISLINTFDVEIAAQLLNNFMTGRDSVGRCCKVCVFQYYQPGCIKWCPRWSLPKVFCLPSSSPLKLASLRHRVRGADDPFSNPRCLLWSNFLLCSSTKADWDGSTLSQFNDICVKLPRHKYILCLYLFEHGIDVGLPLQVLRDCSSQELEGLNCWHRVVGQCVRSLWPRMFPSVHNRLYCLEALTSFCCATAFRDPSKRIMQVNCLLVWKQHMTGLKFFQLFTRSVQY